MFLIQPRLLGRIVEQDGLLEVPGAVGSARKRLLRAEASQEGVCVVKILFGDRGILLVVVRAKLEANAWASTYHSNE